MVFTTAAALAGAPLAMHKPLRQVFGAILGVMLGSAFTPQLAGQLPTWGFIALISLFAAGVAGFFGYWIFRTLGRLGPDAAFLAAMPGGINEAAIIAEDTGVDPRPVMLAHAIRILIVILLLAPLFRIFFDAGPSNGGPAFLPAGELTLREAGVLVACAVIGFPLARLLKLPAPVFVGPMVLSAAAHMTGLSHAAPPGWLIALSQVVLGAGLGARFSNLGGHGLIRPAATSVLVASLMAAVSAAAAAGAALVLSLSIPSAILGFAPGGVTEMSLIALAIGADPAFVSALHIIRIGAVIIIAPKLFFAMRDKTT